MIATTGRIALLGHGQLTSRRARAGWRLLDAAGQPAGSALYVAPGQVRVVDADGTHVATIEGKRGERTRARLLTPAGQLLGQALHEPGLALSLIDRIGWELARVIVPPEADATAQARSWPLLAAGGHAIGTLSCADRRPAAARLGFRSARVYAVTLDAPGAIGQPLRTLAILLPVLAAFVD